jgi:hypothetical protein
LALNGRIFTEQAFALFTTGATAPTSDTGPWAKNGNSWYYWDTVSGQYVPFVLEPESLGYYVGSATPDHTVYTVWVQLDGGGSPTALKTYYGGAWVDVYATTLAGYLTTAAAAATYLTIANAAATYQPLNSNLTLLTSSTLGDIIYSSNTNTLAKLGGNTTTNKRFLTQTGTGVASAAPAWAAIVAGDIPDVSATYLTVATAAATYQPQASMSSYLTTASAAATYQTIASMANYSTTSQMNTAINNAVSGLVAGAASFSAHPTATQSVVFGGAGNQTGAVTLGTEDFDPDNVFAASTFTAPATGYYQFNLLLSVSVSSGSPTHLDIIALLTKNGSAVAYANQLDGGETLNGGVFTGSAYLYLAANDAIELRYDITSDAAATVDIDSNSKLSGYRMK